MDVLARWANGATSESSKGPLLHLLRMFVIEESVVRQTLQWAKDTAGLDVEHLRSSLAAGRELCELCYSLSKYYEDSIPDCRQQLIEGKGDPVINEKRLPLLEIGEKTNNLVGYLTLLQMDAVVSLINMMEAKSDEERLLVCKHAYTILYEARVKGLSRVITKQMRELPEEVLPSEDLDSLLIGMREIKRFMVSESEAENVRNTIDAHKSGTFSEQLLAYESCDFRKCFASMYGLTRLAYILQEAMGIVRRNLGELEKSFFAEVEERKKKWEELEDRLRRDWGVNPERRTQNHE